MTLDPALRNRLTFGPLMLAGLFGLLYIDFYAQKWTTDLHPGGIGGVGILLLLWIVLPLSAIELARMFKAEQVRPSLAISILATTLLTLHGFLTQFDSFKPISTSTLAGVFAAVMITAALRMAWMRQTQEAIHHMAGTLLATLYLGGLAWFLIALRVKQTDTVDGSTQLVLMILLVVKFTDVGAYFGGKLLGRTKLIPWLSPGKTWEGLAIGLVVAAAIGAACAPYVLKVSVGKAILFAVLIGAVGQLGDLLESLMKRDADVKDAGKSIPGFGGMLDVIDSPLLAAPIAYLLFSLF
jgi:phosphatidate cytidylyltransferase